MSGEIKQLVDAICHGDNDTLLREHAVAIAESQLWLSCIGWEKLAALERLCDPEEDALTGRNNRRGLAKIKAKVALRIRRPSCEAGPSGRAAEGIPAGRPCR